jgi:hypothetical protein
MNVSRKDMKRNSRDEADLEDRKMAKSPDKPGLFNALECGGG